MVTDYDSDDSISLTSTVGSDPDEDQVYAVECILAEKELDHGERRYLVKWDGYPIERATWEPIDHFDDRNTVNEWLAKKDAGDIPDFNWREWERQREAELRAQRIRKLRREKKRRQTGYYKKIRRKIPGRPRDDLQDKLDGFVVDDDEEVEDGSESEMAEYETSEEDEDVSRKRKHESEDSDDSLMASLKRQEKKRAKSREAEEKPRERNKPNPKKVEKRKRQPSPAELLHRDASKLSLGAYREAAKPGPAKKPRTEGLKRPGPSAKVPGPAKLFTTLSRVNRANKASRNEPPPDPSRLELFKPADLKFVSSRRLSLQSPVIESFPEASNKPLLQPLNTNSSAWITSSEAEATPMPTASLKSNGRVLGIGPILESPLADVMDFSYSNPPTAAFRDQPSFQAMSGGEITPITIAPVTTGPREYECHIDVGPPNAKLDLGSAILQGLSGNFIDFLIQKQVNTLWFDKFLLQDYIEAYLAPNIDRILETADVIVDGDKVQPVMNCLISMRGAAVMIHESFTMVAFHKTNDKIRDAFKVSRLSSKKAYLRLAIIPPLAIDEDATSEETTPVLFSPVHSGYYLHTLLHCFLGFNFDDILQKEKSRKRVESFVIYCPEISQSESLELQHALSLYNKKVIDVKDLGGRISYGTRFTALIHQSLRRQLHLLPHIARLQAHDCNFYLFGTKIENGILTCEPVRIWGMGRVIFVTPQLVVSNTQLWEHCVAYQKSKDSTTRIALPSTWSKKFEEACHTNPTEALAKAIFDIKDMISKGKIIEIEVEEYPDSDDVEVMLDRFAFFQLENCAAYRQFAFAHLEIPQSCNPKHPLYTNLQIYHVGNLIEQLPLSKLASAKVPGKHESDIAPRIKSPAQPVAG